MFLVTFLILLILLLILIAALLFIYPVKVLGVFNSELQPDIHLMMSWLNPFLKSFITRHEGHTKLTVSLFEKKIFEKDLATKKNAKTRNYMDYINLARSLKIYSARLYASYGFSNPAVTGVVCGAFDFISQYVDIDELDNNADFMAYDDYFNISAQAYIDAGRSLVRIWRRRNPHFHPHVLGGSK